MGKRKSISGYEVIPKQQMGVQTQSYERSSKYGNLDKSTGDYSRVSETEKFTESQRHVERGSRREGVRDEYETTKKFKVGNDNGYSEYQYKETYRNVTYDKKASGTKSNGGGTKNNGGDTKYLTSSGGSGYGGGSDGSEKGYYYSGYVEYYKG